MDTKKTTTKKTTSRKANAKRAKTDFLAFILDVEYDGKLALEFMSKTDADSLHDFFQKKGYTDISVVNCSEILSARKHWEQIFGNVQHGKHPCHGIQRGY